MHVPCKQLPVLNARYARVPAPYLHHQCRGIPALQAQCPDAPCSCLISKPHRSRVELKCHLPCIAQPQHCQTLLEALCKTLGGTRPLSSTRHINKRVGVEDNHIKRPTEVGMSRVHCAQQLGRPMWNFSRQGLLLHVACLRGHFESSNPENCRSFKVGCE